MPTITTTAPAKAILIGEHAVNRGAAALAVSIGLRARCTITVSSAAEADYRFTGGGQTQRTSRDAVLVLGAMVDRARQDADYATIQHLAANDFFAPGKYILAAFGAQLPPTLDIRFQSEIPQSAGLGSGAATGVALATAITYLLDKPIEPRLIAALAQRGDIIAHGGTASGLDSQTSLYGGAIRYTAEREGVPIPCADGLTLVIGNTGVLAATSTVNGRVRAWLAERPVRMHYFQEINLLAHHAELALRDGNWPELGHLINLNQLILERIGVSCQELEALNEAALAAGAYGAKLSGSGGGGIMIALVPPERCATVAQAITAAGGQAIVAAVGVPGIQMISDEERSDSAT